MKTRLAKLSGVVLAAFFLASAPETQAQVKPEVLDWAAITGYRYRLYNDLVYKTASGTELKLDVYAPSKKHPGPTVVYIHGGGWVGLTKETAATWLLPFMAMGLRVVNVEYRLAGAAKAPAAVEDCRCALRWVYRHAEDYGFDLHHLVLSGHSAGGHLALTTGMLRPSDGFDYDCPGEEDLKVQAIVNFFGVTDVADLVEKNSFYAQMWLGSQVDRLEMARKVSPMTYVRSEIPPILTIHGDQDELVPYSQAVRFHEALERAGVVNKLITIPGRGHGNFDDDQFKMVTRSVYQFLQEQGVFDKPEPEGN